MTETTTPLTVNKQRSKHHWLYDIGLIILLLIGAYFRLVGLDWDADQNLHPDERFLTGVETALIPVKSFSDYWNTETSTLNPHNQGYGFFVYGTLPIFAVRYAAEWLGQTGWNDINLVGRQLSALADLLVIVVVYLAGTHLYGRRVGLLAAAFSTFTVLQIQLSHFFAVDTFLTLYTFLSVYLAIKVATAEEKPDAPPFKIATFIWFGITLGMAVSSKVITVPVAVTLPMAVLIRLFKMRPDKRHEHALTAISYLFVAAVVSIFTFRIFQPYAFNGPGFFGMLPNEKWLENLKSLRAQTTGDVDWPPSIQWARRPVWFSWQNMVLWGMGLPMGIVAWAGFVWVGVRMLTGNWPKHLLMWAWTGAYFLWQSSLFNPTMRYEIPIYPPLAIFAGWAIVALWDSSKKYMPSKAHLGTLLRSTAIVLGVLSLGLTIMWATAFIQVYTRPVTRVEASNWIYQNIPGPLTLAIETQEGLYHQPLSYPYEYQIKPDHPYTTSFVSKATGTLSKITLKNASFPPESRNISLAIIDSEVPDIPLAVLSTTLDFGVDPTKFKGDLKFTPNPPLVFTAQKNYVINFNLDPAQDEITLQKIILTITSPTGQQLYTIPADQEVITPGITLKRAFNFPENTTLTDITLTASITPSEIQPDRQNLHLTLSNTPDYSQELATSDIILDLSAGESETHHFILNQSVNLEAEEIYHLRVSTGTEGGVVTLQGSAILVEGPWDDGLPLRTGGYDGYAGIYQRDLNLDMYADDNPEKRGIFLSRLEAAEYFAISSSRQWASTTRIPERFPMNVVFYRHLMGCPEEMTIEYCYNIADVGMFTGDLGFDLVRVFQSDPNLGDYRINDQFAEEAFTVYDHPKVFIFEKRDDYDHEHVSTILNAVDLSNVVRLTPKQAGKYKEKSLLLPPDRLEEQRSGGTWSELFKANSLINRYQFVAVLVWYLAVAVLGLAMVPLLRLALPGLADRGYPMARIAGMFLLAYLCWVAGSAGVTFDRPLTWGIYGLILLLGVWQGYRQRDELIKAWREKRGYFLRVEMIFLAFFLFSLIVRIGNPDLWHPFKGGEKPMDFSYLNAVLKSSSFPPYDPWYADGYINYYYYGFVFVGVLVKMLGIAPAVAYNLIIPTLFAMLSMGAFSIAWNLIQTSNNDRQRNPPWWVGVAAALGTGLIGNLGSLRMIFRGFQQLGAMGEYDINANLLTKWGWAARGFVETLFGNPLPYSFGDWYWLPSRAIATVPGEPEPITEFPWFTFIYADLHAHMIALPIAILALGWIVSIALGKNWVKKAGLWQTIWSLLFGALVIGALRPTNTWDLPTYLALGIVAITYVILRFYQPPAWKLNDIIDQKVLKGLIIVIAAALLSTLAYKLLYLPFDHWYDQPYTEIQLWTGAKTTTQDYLTHWGVFLFIITSWMVWETRQWMASTPLSSLRKLTPYRSSLLFLGIVFLVVYIMLFILGIRIHWLALLLALWATILLLKPKLPEAKKVVLFIIGTCLFLTVMVEVIVLTGDVGRMNTVFKFYLQVWVMYAVCSAAMLGWLAQDIKLWSPNWRLTWQLVLIVLFSAASLFPLLGTVGKINDRISVEAPHSLDGMAFMPSGEYFDEGGLLELGKDYKAILWLQQNVEGSPVIVEANAPLYHWGSRMTIYTGLPGVLGWDWHQIQQRGFVPTSKIPERREAIINFYKTTDIESAKDFLATYDVTYIILCQMERNFYPGPGLEKFHDYDGILWHTVYRNGDNVIYQVNSTAILGD